MNQQNKDPEQTVDYTTGSYTSIDDEKPKQDTLLYETPAEVDKQYTSGKPKRIIIRARITYD